VRARTCLLLGVCWERTSRMKQSECWGQRRRGKGSCDEQQSEGVYCTSTHGCERKREVGLEVRARQEKGDGDGQNASGIGCRGDEKRIPNYSRLHVNAYLHKGLGT
jgi:hypothetical protein